jgi:hypothetical protein
VIPDTILSAEVLITNKGVQVYQACPGYTGTLRKSILFSAPPGGAQD